MFCWDLKLSLPFVSNSSQFNWAQDASRHKEFRKVKESFLKTVVVHHSALSRVNILCLHKPDLGCTWKASCTLYYLWTATRPLKWKINAHFLGFFGFLIGGLDMFFVVCPFFFFAVGTLTISTIGQAPFLSFNNTRGITTLHHGHTQAQDIARATKRKQHPSPTTKRTPGQQNYTSIKETPSRFFIVHPPFLPTQALLLLSIHLPLIAPKPQHSYPSRFILSSPLA